MAIPYGTGYSPPLQPGIYPEPLNVPPRFGIGILDPSATTATVYRSDDSGESVVRGTPVTLDSSGAATVYDYESQFNTDTTYTVVTA